jgi:hypothetical protein
MKDVKVKSYFRGDTLRLDREFQDKLLASKVGEIVSPRDEYQIKNLAYAKRLVPPFPRYYFWENVGKSYGIRQMGRTDGYDSIEELKREQKWSFDEIKLSGSPAQIWILKAVPVQKFEATL